MSFFEDLGDAFESNAGWFMLANMVNTNRIASAQTSIAQAQRDADRNSHRLKLRELELLEKEAKEANRDRQERRAREELDRQQRDAEATSRRKFLSSFAYSQLTFEQNDEWGFSLASLDILIPSLQSLLDVSAASSEEIQTFERFVVKVDRARSAFLLGSNAKTYQGMAADSRCAGQASRIPNQNRNPTQSIVRHRGKVEFDGWRRSQSQRGPLPRIPRQQSRIASTRTFFRSSDL